MSRVAEEFRGMAMSFPEATEDFPWGDRVIKVRKKVFVFMCFAHSQGMEKTKI